MMSLEERKKLAKQTREDNKNSFYMNTDNFIVLKPVSYLVLSSYSDFGSDVWTFGKSEEEFNKFAPLYLIIDKKGSNKYVYSTKTNELYDINNNLVNVQEFIYNNPLGNDEGIRKLFEEVAPIPTNSKDSKPKKYILKFKDGIKIEVEDSKGKTKEEIIAEAKQVHKEFKDNQNVKDYLGLNKKNSKPVNLYRVQTTVHWGNGFRSERDDFVVGVNIKNAKSGWEQANNYPLTDSKIREATEEEINNALANNIYVFDASNSDYWGKFKKFPIKDVLEEIYDDENENSSTDFKQENNEFKDSQVKDDFVDLNFGNRIKGFVGLIYPCKDNTWDYVFFNEEDNKNLEEELYNKNATMKSLEFKYDSNGEILYVVMEEKKNVPEEKLNERGIGRFSNFYKALQGMREEYYKNSINDSKPIQDEDLEEVEAEIIAPQENAVVEVPEENNQELFEGTDDTNTLGVRVGEDDLIYIPTGRVVCRNFRRFIDAGEIQYQQATNIASSVCREAGKSMMDMNDVEWVSSIVQNLFGEFDILMVFASRFEEEQVTRASLEAERRRELERRNNPQLPGNR